MARRPDDEEITRADAHVIGLLNEVEAVLKGWVIRAPAELVDKWLDPVYVHLDTDPATRPTQDQS